MSRLCLTPADFLRVTSDDRNYLIKYLTTSTVDSKSMAIEDSSGSTEKVPEKDSYWATKKAADPTACKSAKGQLRLPRQHQCHDVHRGQGVEQHEQGRYTCGFTDRSRQRRLGIIRGQGGGNRGEYPSRTSQKVLPTAGGQKIAILRKIIRKNVIFREIF